MINEEVKMKFRWEKELKDTEIGDIPKDWEVRELNSILIDIVKGHPPKKIIGKFPYLSAKYLRGEEAPIETYSIEAGVFVEEDDIIVLWDGSNSGEIFKAKTGILASTMCKLLIHEKLIEKKYLYLVLKSQENEIKDAKSGTDDRHVDKEYFLRISIPYPSPSEQSRIATVLSWFDDLIENKKRQNEILEKTAMAIFKNWFIDFEPFKGSEFVYNEELGREIPKGWEVKRIGHAFTLIKGKKCNLLSEKIEGANPYLLIESFKNNSNSFWTLEKEPMIDELDVVLVADGESSGKVFSFKKGILGSTLLTLKQKVREKFFDLRTLVYLFLKFNEDEIIEHRTGSAIPHLDKDYLIDFLFYLPPPPILQSFHSLVEPLFQKIILNQKQIMLFRKIRDRLLPLLVFGKLRVEEI